MVRQIFLQMPVVKDLLARATFDAVAEIELRDWRDVGAATRWAHARWNEEGHGYRRRIDKVAHIATFEFADQADAVEFTLRFG